MVQRDKDVLQNRAFDAVTRRVTRRQFVTGSASAMAGVLAVHAGISPVFAQDASPAPASGGRLLIGMIQEPGQLNQFFNGQSGSFLAVLTQEPLFVADADGNYQPWLASEVPTLENGGISEDFLTITYRIKEGILWSDGTPLTADDFAFTVQVQQDPGSTPLVESAWDLIETATAIDPLTVEVKMSQINPGYLELFKQILPKHKFESTAVGQDHPEALMPTGTGPFMITEWKTGDQITFERNPNYREAGKPYLDGITVKITPEKEAAVASFINGELDYLYFVVTGDLPTLTEAQNAGQPVVVVETHAGTATEWLWLNLGTNGDPNTPHPVLGDVAVRTAMDFGIDRQSIVDEVLGGFGTLHGAYIFAGWAAAETPPTEYNPETARQILEEAGWVEGEGGVREKNGVRASLRYQTIAGDQVRELYQQVVQQNLKEIGIELNIENVPSNTIFGSFDEGGILPRGNFDILMSRDGDYIDPAEWMSLFTTAAIPSEENPAGFTYSFLSDPQFDELAAEATQTLDQEARLAIYQQMEARLQELKPCLPLYRSAAMNAFSTRMHGYRNEYFEGSGTLFSAADWYVSE
jgi:peptide/nickel transport system substrate-binding protein